MFRTGGTAAAPRELGAKDARVPFKYAGQRVLSVTDILNAGNIAMPGWGYVVDEGDAVYPSKSRSTVSQKFSAMVGTVREWHDTQTDIEARQKRYVLEKVHADAHGSLFRFKVLELVKTE